MAKPILFRLNFLQILGKSPFLARLPGAVPFPSPGFVQGANNSSDATATSIGVTFQAGVGIGRLIVVQVCHGGTVEDVTSVTDTLGTVYKERKFLAGQNVSGSLWSGITTAAGPNTVTANLTATQTFRRIAVHEVAGFRDFDLANALRQAEPASSGSITPSVNGCYLFGCMHWDQGGDETIKAGTNVAWILRNNYQHANAPAATEDFIQGTAAAVNATFVESGTGNNVIAFIAAFRPLAVLEETDDISRFVQYPISAQPYNIRPTLFDDEPPAGLLRGASEDSADVSGVVYPIQTASNVPLYWFDDEARPLPSVPSQDEDYWWTSNQQSLLLTYPQQWDFEQHEQATGLYQIFDEDFWQVSNQQVTTLVYPEQWPFHDDAVFIHVDDADYWQVNATAALPYSALYWFDAGEQVFITIDDSDYWQVTTLPWAANVYPQPWFDNAESVFTYIDDDDYWQVSTTSWPLPQPLYWFDSADDRYFAPLDDAEVWTQTIQLAAPQNYPQPWFDAGEAAFLFINVDDADYWLFTIPQVFTAQYTQPWSYEQNEQATGLYVVFDEDFWQVQTPQQVSNPPTPYIFPDEETWIVPPSALGIDEDYWHLYQPPCVPNTPQLFQDTDDLTHQFIDEDYWWIGTMIQVPQKYPQQWDMAQEDGGSDLFSAPRVIPAVPGFTRYMTEADRIEWQDRRIEKNKLPPL